VHLTQLVLYTEYIKKWKLHQGQNFPPHMQTDIKAHQRWYLRLTTFAQKHICRHCFPVSVFDLFLGMYQTNNVSMISMMGVYSVLASPLQISPL
jgi:hypothetical protein